jgi:hypothetical protein
MPHQCSSMVLQPARAAAVVLLLLLLMGLPLGAQQHSIDGGDLWLFILISLLTWLDAVGPLFGCLREPFLAHLAECGSPLVWLLPPTC